MDPGGAVIGTGNGAVTGALTCVRGGRLRKLALLLGAAALLGAATVRKPVRPRPRAAPANALVNAQALAPFFDALERLAQPGADQPVRVLQFGDSHTAADFWSGRVRARLQARFGDGGPGWILPARPWRGYPHDGVHLLSGLKWPAQCLRSPDCDGLVGLTGAAIVPVAGEEFQLEARWRAARVVLLAAGDDQVTARLAPAGDDGQDPPAVQLPRLAVEPIQGGLQLETFGVDGLDGDPVQRLSLALPEGSRLLGVDLSSGRPGVVYDELGLNGAELLDLERWQPDLRSRLLAQVRPSLVVLAYGTNDMGMSAAARADYPEQVRGLLAEFKRASSAPVLVVGPLDRLGRSRRQRPALKDGAAWEIATLRQACLDADCAFWDAREAMGGYGSLLKWRRAGLAQRDMVHLDGPGYQRLGDLLSDALLKAMDDRRKPAAAPAPEPSPMPAPAHRAHRRHRLVRPW